MSGKKTKILIAAIIALSIYMTLSLLGYSTDQLRLLFIKWQKGEPVMLVKLRVHVPQVNADRCFVAIHRFPTMYNPTKNGGTERIYAGIVKPGSVVEAEKILTAIPVKMRLDKFSDKYTIEYYEPQEFIVIVGCTKNGKTVLKWGKVVEVYPNKIINTYDINVPAKPRHQRPVIVDKAVTKGRHYEVQNIGNQLSCDIHLTVNDRTHAEGYCHTWVKGPLLHSTGGLTTSFGICAGGIPGCGSATTAIYLTTFTDFVSCNLGVCDHDGPQWSSAGRKLVPSIVKKETAGLTGYEGCESSVRLYFEVEYRYEYWEYEDAYAGYKYWILSPTKVASVERADYLGLGYVQYNCPAPTPPSYAYYELGNAYISFGQYGARKTDIGIARAYVTFKLAGAWSATLGVDFYKAGRQDQQYQTPYVKVQNSDGIYYWWFKDNDPMNYEIIFSR